MNPHAEKPLFGEDGSSLTAAGESLGLQCLAQGLFSMTFGESGDRTGCLVVTGRPLAP